MQTLKISPDFTIEDIHKIREYHREITRDMTTEQLCAYYNDRAKPAIEQIEQYRREYLNRRAAVAPKGNY